MNQTEIEITKIQHYYQQTKTHQFVNVTIRSHIHEITIPLPLRSHHRFLTAGEVFKTTLTYLKLFGLEIAKNPGAKNDMVEILGIKPDQLCSLLENILTFVGALNDDNYPDPTPWDLTTLKPVTNWCEV